MAVVIDSNIQERFPTFTPTFEPSNMDANSIPDYRTFMDNHAACLEAECPKLWVFGYGSLLWKPGFDYNSYKIGFIENYERKFNQGNETFRGTKDKPGRVANLEEREGSTVWGLAYEICGKKEITQVLKNLYHREIANGGYKVTMTTFHPRKCRGKNNTKCCTQNYHNVPLPHTSCGLSETNPSQNTESPNGLSPQSHWRTQSSSRLSLTTPSHKTFTESTNGDCPCFTRINLKDLSPNNDAIYYCNDKIPSRRLESWHHSYHRKMSSEHIDDLLNKRKLSLDFENRTKQIDLRLSNDSLFSNQHEYNTRTIGQKDILNPQHRADFPPNLNATHNLEDMMSDDESTIPVLLFTVTTENSSYLGPTDVDKMATQIIAAEGTAGTNVEYVLRISDFIKTFIPEDDDSFLFHLAAKINQELLLRTAATEGDGEKADVVTLRINN